MKKILFVSNTANFAKFNRPFMNWCKENGWQVDYCAPDDEMITDCNHHYVLPISRSPFSPSVFKCIKMLKNIINEQKYDVVHCHTPVGSVIARLAAKKLFKKHQTKVIYTAHGFHFYKGAPLKYWMMFYPVEKYLSRFTDVLITINHEDYELASKKFHAKQTVYMDGVGVNFDKFYPVKSEAEKTKLRKEKGFSKEDFIVLYTAEFIPRKNHKLVFDILPDLCSKIPGFKLILAGKGKLLDFYKEKAKELNLDDKILFTGYTTEIDTYCRLSDVLLMPSFQEGLPISMIEAIGTGLPVVASKIRGQVDVIEDGYNGFLCDLSKPEEFVDSICKLFSDKNLRKTMSKNAYQKSKIYNIETAIEKTTKLYN